MLWIALALVSPTTFRCTLLLIIRLRHRTLKNRETAGENSPLHKRPESRLHGRCANLAIRTFFCSAVALLRFEGTRFLAYSLSAALAPRRKAKAGPHCRCCSSRLWLAPPGLSAWLSDGSCDSRARHQPCPACSPGCTDCAALLQCWRRFDRSTVSWKLQRSGPQSPVKSARSEEL